MGGGKGEGGKRQGRKEGAWRKQEEGRRGGK